nr:flavodoxin [uncultured Caldimonas sp.]
MSKVLVVSYSYTGTSRRLAQMLAYLRGWPLGEVFEIRPRQGGSGTWRCVLDSLLQRRPRVRYDGPPLTDFDAVVLVAPVWVSHLASPMRSFVAWQRDSLHDVAVISTQGGEGRPQVAAQVARLLGREPVLSASFMSHEVGTASCAKRLESFASDLLAAEDRAQAARATPLAPQTA